MIQWHNHHIIPRHMGGTDDPKNIIRVNTAMHAFLHKCLWEETGNRLDWIAWKTLSGQINKQEAHRLAIKERLADPVIKEKMKTVKLGRKISKKHADALHKGRRNSKNSLEHNEILRQSRTGVKVPEYLIRRGWKHTEEANNKNRLAHLNKIPSQETREKLRQASLKYWATKKGKSIVGQ